MDQPIGGDAPEAERLMVIVPDAITDLLRKGEITERYYNPGNLFHDVHLVLVNDDHPPQRDLRPLVGDARLTLHNVPAGPSLFLRTAGWRPSLLRRWASQGVMLAEEVRPRLVRCHGSHLNAFIAREIKRSLGIPYIVSLHLNPDTDLRPNARGPRDWLATRAQRTLEKVSLREADLVLPVYEPIVPYLKRLGITRYTVAYNALNPTHLKPKSDYSLGDPILVISTGRQFEQKDPSNLIRAVARIPGMHLKLIGDGALHDHLRLVAKETEAPERISFVKAMPNNELCRVLGDHDIYATHSEFWEISKSVLEALITGLPVIINKRRLGPPVPELDDDLVWFVDDSVDGYEQGLRYLSTNHAARERLGRNARARARARWSPEITEQRFVDLYRSVLARSG